MNKFIDGGSDARELAKGHLRLHSPEPSRVVENHQPSFGRGNALKGPDSRVSSDPLGQRSICFVRTFQRIADVHLSLATRWPPRQRVTNPPNETGLFLLMPSPWV